MSTVLDILFYFIIICLITILIMGQARLDNQRRISSFYDDCRSGRTYGMGRARSAECAAYLLTQQREKEHEK